QESPMARYSARDRAKWPADIQEFAAGAAPDKLNRTGNGGDRLDLMVRHGEDVWGYSASLGGIGMDRVEQEIRGARVLVDSARSHDLRRGVRLVYIVLAAAFWAVSLTLLVYLAHRVSRPIQQLTAGLSQLSAGDLDARVPTDRDDEIGRAIQAFNHMAGR